MDPTIVTQTVIMILRRNVYDKESAVFRPLPKAETFPKF